MFYSSTIWPLEGIRDANLSTTCTIDASDQALIFGLASTEVNINGGQRIGPVASRSIKTTPFLINIIETDPPTSLTTNNPRQKCCRGEVFNGLEWPDTAQGDRASVSCPCADSQDAQAFRSCGGSPTAGAVWSSEIDTAMCLEQGSTITERLCHATVVMVTEIGGLYAIIIAELVLSVGLLRNLTSSEEHPEPAVTLYLLGDILNRFNSTDNGNREQFIEDFLNVMQSLIAEGVQMESILAQPEVIGSSLLSVVDRLALEVFPEVGNVSTGNITIQTQLISTSVEGYITTINSEDYGNDVSKISIQIPPELVGLFADSSVGGMGVVRVISALFYNVENIFPSGRPGTNSSELGSGIVSISLQCGATLCDTTESNLTSPVLIMIEHSNAVMQSQNFEIECVFWQFLTESSSLLTEGQWSNRGCFRNDALSNISQTVCECYHLTHFAILLSPRPINLREDVRISLDAISYIGVAISVVAMAVTIFTFIFLKSLYNMRSYIHINFCVSLMIAQLIFVVGVDHSGGDHVPAHCQAIAVLLHYFFLVSFMWMLMEGVVLYFILVRVFVANTKKYIITFTLASYGLPLLYMGLLTLPLGFALPGPHYGSTSACFLNAETHFIWAFIAPVLVIILTNIGFFVMAAIALWRQRKNQKGKMDRKSIGSWLKALVFLLLIMGITWLLGVLVIDVPALLPVAYIFTIMVAFQGVCIFLSVVAFQKSVRDEYIKWWKRHIKTSNLLSKYFVPSDVSTLSSTAIKGRNGIDSKEESPEKGKKVWDHMQKTSVTDCSMVVENSHV